jgi:hypothetical protein
MLFENYRELVTEKAALEYFGILPETKPNKGSQGSKGKGKVSGKAAAKTPANTPAKRSKKTAGKSSK